MFHILEHSLQFMKEINLICMWECVKKKKKKSDLTPLVILNIFISNCNLITHYFSVTVTDYSYFYFVIKLRNSVTCN